MVLGHVARVSYLLNTTFFQVPRYRIQAQWRPVPKWKVETLYSGTKVGMGFLCARRFFFFFFKSGAVQCFALVAKVMFQNGVWQGELEYLDPGSQIVGMTRQWKARKNMNAWSGKRERWWEKGRERESSAALPLTSLLPFYLRVRAFSISLNRPSRSLEQARAGITLSSGSQGVNTTLFCTATQDRVPSVDLKGLFTLGTWAVVSYIGKIWNALIRKLDSCNFHSALTGCVLKTQWKCRKENSTRYCRSHTR